MSGRFVAALAVTVLHVSGAMAQATAPQAAAGGLEHMFWSGIEALHLTFRAIGTLSGGPDRGAVWQFDVRSHTRTKVGAGTALAWPVQGSDSRVVFALHDGDVVAISVPDGVETKVGPKAAWRKLIGVAPDNTILGLVQDFNRRTTRAADACWRTFDFATRHNRRGPEPCFAPAARGSAVWCRSAAGGGALRAGRTRVRCLRHHWPRPAQCVGLWR